MGKNFQQGSSVFSVQNNGPGCMWGVFHTLKYHHWHYFKKRFPHKKTADGKKSVGVGNSGPDLKASKSKRILHHGFTEDDTVGENEKMTEPTPTNKVSVKSRLKSRISEELHKMKGRHRRASSCPSQSFLMRTILVHHFEPSDEDPPAANTLNDESPDAAKNLNVETPTLADNKNFSSPSLVDSLVPNSSDNQSTKDCSTMLTGNNSGIDASQKHHILFSRDSNNEDQNLVHAKELYMDTSTCQSKEILDALDIINMNKEFFLKVLQDPGSPFANHFHSQQALSSKKAYSKSLSFSSTSSSSIRGSEPRNVKPKKEIIVSNAVEAKCKEYIRSHSMPSVPAEFQTAHHKKNQAVIKRFKNLKDKIKHVIRQSKNEERRITMDGVLHRIPRGQKLPKDLKTENHSAIRDDNDSPRSSCDSHNSAPTNKTGTRCISRTSSLSESLDRYCQLYETSRKGEAKPHCFEPLKLKNEDSPQRSFSKSIRRLSSLPDLKSYSCYNEDSSDAFPSSHVREAGDTTLITISDTSGQLNAESSVKSHIQQNLDNDTISVDGDPQELKTISSIEVDAKFDLTSDDLEASCSKQNTEPSEPNSIPIPDTTFQEDDTSPAIFSSTEEEDLKLRICLPLPDEIDCSEEQLAETVMKEIATIAAESGIEKIEIPRKHIQFQVGAKDKAEFDYVKDILELSGFSKNELLGTWHADDQPMDPSLFEEVAGCMFLDPECTPNEEDYPCYYLLLFDLINEVLMEIYARSYTYCPTPLSALSHIRPMPVGHHVLEEVWTNISWYLGSTPEADQLLDYIVSRDLAKFDGWMNLQFDSECVGLEVEDIIFDDLLDEVICS